MKLLVIYPDLSFRGGERLFIDFANEMHRNGHNVIFIAARTKIKIDRLNNNIQLIKPPIFINNLFQKNIFFLFFSLPLTYLNIQKNIRNCDYIYSSEQLLSLWPAVFAAKLNRKKSIIAIFELGGPLSKTKSIRGLIIGLLTNINILFAKHATHRVSINPSLVNRLQRVYKIKKVKFIHAGLDFSIFYHPEPAKLIKKYNLYKKSAIIMPGVIHPFKKQLFALEILNELIKIKQKIVLIFIGSGDIGYIQKLQNYAKENNLQKNVFFTGYINDNEFKDYYALAKMVLMCGPIAGLTVIEALFMGRMPIYPASPGKLLGPAEPFKIGLVINNYDKKAFANKIIDYLNNTHKYREKLTRDKEFVEKNFSVSNYTKNLLTYITK